jgi:hypothetical protein
MTLHFGLGQATKVDKLEVQWANGSIETFDASLIDKLTTIVQGKGVGK